ncbi:MAG: hypothetical protein MUF49_28745 [Oculatellaceae cyanobacterium Prado106]|jgi:hypothetical protein|nr:hypothetical protein [Oculatellaceae cyanobacterium Prado106]
MNSHTLRFCLLVFLCSLSGIALSLFTSQAALSQCATQQPLTDECLVSNPQTKQLESVGQGLVAGVCAAIAASWNVRKREM